MIKKSFTKRHWHCRTVFLITKSYHGVEKIHLPLLAVLTRCAFCAPYSGSHILPLRRSVISSFYHLVKRKGLPVQPSSDTSVR